MLVEEARVDRRGLLAGAGIHLRAHAVEDLVDLDRAETVGALEQQVLEEMRDASLSRRLVPRPCADEHAQRDRADRGHCLGHYSNAGVELRQLVFSAGQSGLTLVASVVGARGPVAAVAAAASVTPTAVTAATAAAIA